MKQCYYFTVEEDARPVIADLSFNDGIVSLFEPERRRIAWVHRINVPAPARGKGYGTRLLGLITDDADLEGVTVYLAPLATGGLSQRQLVAWYKRHGFEAGPNYILIREPSHTGVRPQVLLPQSHSK